MGEYLKEQYNRKERLENCEFINWKEFNKTAERIQKRIKKTFFKDQNTTLKQERKKTNDL